MTDQSVAAQPFNPERPTDFNRSRWEKEHFLTFAVLVANKPAARTRVVLANLLVGIGSDETPFEYLAFLDRTGILDATLRACRTGQYRRIGGALQVFARGGIDVETCTIQDLEAVPGIGQKTSRFFMLHAREGTRCAVLDTHVLKWLVELGYPAPRGTPREPGTYRRLEDVFLAEADKRGVTPQDLDARIWLHYARGEGRRP